MKRLLVSCCALLLLGAGFGPDLRQPLHHDQAYRSLVKICAGGGVGCGVLIGPHLVLTARHCIASPNGQIHQGGWVEIGGQRVNVDTVFLNRQFDNDPASGQDWAILRLTRPLGFREGWIECLSLDNDRLQNLPVEIVAYSNNPDDARPEFAQGKAAYRCPGQVPDVGAQIIFHNCAMWGGASGSPLLHRTPEGEYRVVAVNSAGVEVEGEKLDHGFRPTYSRGTANVAVPARNWAEKLAQIPRPPRPNFRHLDVENTTGKPLQVRLRYNSLYTEIPLQERVMTVLPLSKARLLDNWDGCADNALELATPGDPTGPYSGWRTVTLNQAEGDVLALP